MNDLDKLVKALYDYIFDKEDKSVNPPSLQEELDKLPPATRAIVEKLDSKDILHESATYSRFKKENKPRKATVLRHIHERTDERGRNRSVLFLRYIAAACAIVAISVCGFLFMPRANGPEAENQITHSTTVIQPGGSSAKLTLSDGKVIQLDAVPEGIIMHQGLHYADGRPIDSTMPQAANIMLTLETPRGGEYVLTLSDGSRVHLNAESKLVYPMSFQGNTREVILYGEAFFDIAPNQERPFHVHTDNNEVVVLGTRFNIRSYQEEKTSYVTLVEGKVRLQDGYDNPELTPGMQGISDGRTTQIKAVNVDDFVSWKDGLFVFHNENIDAVAAKISRWYDIDIHVAPSAKQVRIWGSLSKYDTFDKVLDVLKLIDNDLKINIDERRVNIMK